jgi:hypothetical protein
VEVAAQITYRRRGPDHIPRYTTAGVVMNLGNAVGAVKRIVKAILKQARSQFSLSKSLPPLPWRPSDEALHRRRSLQREHATGDL